MAQVFHRSFNQFAKISILGFPLFAGAVGIGLAVFYRSSYATGIHEVVSQPVQFSHQHHVGELGISCRHCHYHVEESSYAGIPPTKVCMSCHQVIWTGANDHLNKVRASWTEDKPIVWNKVHNVPHYTYFNHSIHVNKGIGCINCHGRLDKMQLTWQNKTLLMEWCLECHRNPENYVGPREEVQNLRWTPGGEKPFDGHTVTEADWKALEYLAVPDAPPAHLAVEFDYDEFQEKYPVGKKLTTQDEIGEFFAAKYHIRDERTLTSCSMCHR